MVEEIKTRLLVLSLIIFSTNDETFILKRFSSKILASFFNVFVCKTFLSQMDLNRYFRNQKQKFIKLLSIIFAIKVLKQKKSFFLPETYSKHISRSRYFRMLNKNHSPITSLCNNILEHFSVLRDSINREN